MKSRRVRWTRHVARNGDEESYCGKLKEKNKERNKTFERPKRKW